MFKWSVTALQGMNSPPPGADQGPDEEPTTSSFDGALPKKGILKRSALRQQAEARDTVPPLREFRPSPDRFPDKPSTKIPKLSVTWWEKNAVAVFGDTSDENTTENESDLPSPKIPPNIRQTEILNDSEDSEDASLDGRPPSATWDQQGPLREDDEMSVASSAGSGGSHIAGRWWFGKSTRYVPHCEKRGCKHTHHDLGTYLTPTQRRNKEMVELKKQLAMALADAEEKERHLQEIRSRISAVEQMKDSSAAMSENQRMLRRETLALFEKERKMMEKRHAVRVNQLVHETMAAREEVMKLTLQIKELEERSKPIAETTDAGTMTEAIEIADPIRLPVRSLPVTPLQSPLGEGAPFSSVMSSSLDSRHSAHQYLSQDALNQMQAYHNEALIWRTKAAQLEIVVKDQLFKASQNQVNIERDLENYKKENERLRELLQNQGIAGGGGIMVDSGIENPSGGSPLHTVSLVASATSPISPSGECTNPTCVEKKRNLISENDKLIETMEDISVRIRELEDDIATLRQENEALDAGRIRDAERLKEAAREADMRQAESAASVMLVTKLQNEKDALQKAICYMEERVQVYRDTLMDHDLVVSDEPTTDWRHGFKDSRYSVLVSKRTQTALTSEALAKNENEFLSVQEQLKDFTSRRKDLHGRFEEIEQNLMAKTKLVETLTKQLDEARKESKEQIERAQLERDLHNRKLNETAAIAQRVPALESQIERLLAEKSRFDIILSGVKEEYEKALEDALAESLKKYQEQTRYWNAKLNNAETATQNYKNKVTMLEREKDEQRLKAKLERVDLEQRLTSSIDYASTLHKHIHRSTRDVECEARPRQVSKYVACRPNAKHRPTQIEKGDLYDETEEQLKLAQGELNTTRRQIEVLQQKLFEQRKKPAHTWSEEDSFVTPIASERSEPAYRSAEAVHIEGSCEDFFNERVELLEKRNADLRAKIEALEEDRAAILDKDKQRIQQLVTEFDNVRKELDEEIGRYESEKKHMKAKIRSLEKAKAEAERTISEMRRIEKVSSDTNVKNCQVLAPPPSPKKSTAGVSFGIDAPRIRVEESPPKVYKLRSTSEPHLDKMEESEEMHKLRAENERLQQELIVLRESLKRTVSMASGHSLRSQLSPGFGDLAADLNHVKTDLEKMLHNIDDEQKLLKKSSPVSVLQNASTDSRSAASDDPEKIVQEWENEERERMAKDLRRSREERDELRKRLSACRKELRSALAELEVFRSEPRTQEVEKTRPIEVLRRYASVDNLDPSPSPLNAPLIKWKERASTMFRELARMRDGYNKAQSERRELRVQLAMLKGEMELLKCQNECRTQKADVSTEVKDMPLSKESFVVKGGLPSLPNQNLCESTTSFTTACQSLHSLHTAETPYTSSHSLAIPMAQSWHEETANASLQKEKWPRGIRVDEVKLLKDEIAKLKKDIVEYQEKFAENLDALKRCELLQSENELYEKKIRELEEEQKDIYLVMFKKGQQAAAHMRLVDEHDRPVDELTEDKIVLRFLHDALYYYLLNKGDAREHLQAMMTMLNFTSQQKDDVYRRRGVSS